MKWPSESITGWVRRLRISAVFDFPGIFDSPERAFKRQDSVKRGHRQWPARDVRGGTSPAAKDLRRNQSLICVSCSANSDSLKLAFGKGDPFYEPKAIFHRTDLHFPHNRRISCALC